MLEQQTATLHLHDKDPARRFKAALLNEGFAVSPDGVQWTKLDLPAIPSSDEGNFSYVSELVTGNQPRASLRWKSGNLNSVTGGTVSLRLSLRNARLYSFWSE